MSDIVELLRKQIKDTRWSTEPPECIPGIDLDVAEDACDEILRLRAENEKLRAALKPFAAQAGGFVGWSETIRVNLSVPVGVLRAATAALKETGDE